MFLRKKAEDEEEEDEREERRRKRGKERETAIQVRINNPGQSSRRGSFVLGIDG